MGSVDRYYKELDFKASPVVAEKVVRKHLINTFFSRGHRGSDFDLDDIEVMVERRWIDRKLELLRVMSKSHQRTAVRWIRKVAEKHHRKFPYYDDPIIIGPNWTSQPIALGHPDLTILDGWHRFGEALNRGHAYINAWIGDPEDEE